MVAMIMVMIKVVAMVVVVMIKVLTKPWLTFNVYDTTWSPSQRQGCRLPRSRGWAFLTEPSIPLKDLDGCAKSKLGNNRKCDFIHSQLTGATCSGRAITWSWLDINWTSPPRPMSGPVITLLSRRRALVTGKCLKLLPRSPADCFPSHLNPPMASPAFPHWRRASDRKYQPLLCLLSFLGTTQDKQTCPAKSTHLLCVGRQCSGRDKTKAGAIITWSSSPKVYICTKTQTMTPPFNWVTPKKKLV